MDVDHKGLNQLLLSPLYLYDQILSIVIPGAVFMLLLGLKGNPLLRVFWYQSPLGYKTKIAAFLVLAFVVGHLVKLPLTFLVSLWKTIKKEDISGFPEGLQKQTPEVQTMLKGTILEGALLATPGLLDRLSLTKADAGFHVGTGTALLIAATIPGDGSLRYWEALIGLIMLWVGFWKAKEHRSQTLGTIGVGLANVFARMSPQQWQIAAAIWKGITSTSTESQSAVPPAEAAPPLSDAAQTKDTEGEPVPPPDS